MGSPIVVKLTFGPPSLGWRVSDLNICWRVGCHVLPCHLMGQILTKKAITKINERCLTNQRTGLWLGKPVTQNTYGWFIQVASADTECIRRSIINLWPENLTCIVGLTKGAAFIASHKFYLRAPRKPDCMELTRLKQ